MIAFKGYFIVLLIVTNWEIHFTHSSVLIVKQTRIEHKIGNDRTTNSTDISNLFRAKRDSSSELASDCVKYLMNKTFELQASRAHSKDQKIRREDEKKKDEFCCKMYALSGCPKDLKLTEEAYNKTKEKGCAYIIGEAWKCHDVGKGGSPVFASSSVMFIITIIPFYALYLV
jgi:hypothetical protein